MTMITGALKWDLFVVYIIMCVIFVALCCFSITCMFLCCPARNQNGSRVVTPMTPFATTGLAANMALRAAGITAVVPTPLENHNSTNSEMFSRSRNQSQKSIVKFDTPIVKRNEKITRFAEHRKSRSRSIDMASLSPSIDVTQQGISQRNQVSSRAIVEPLPSDKVEKHLGKGTEISYKPNVCHNTKSLGTMTPSSSSQVKGKHSNRHHSLKSSRSLRKLKRTSSSNMHPLIEPVECTSSRGTTKVSEPRRKSRRTVNVWKPSGVSLSDIVLISNDEIDKTEIGSGNDIITETESSTVPHLNTTADCENENSSQIVQRCSSPIEIESDIVNDATRTETKKNNVIEGIIRNFPAEQNTKSNKVLNESGTKPIEEHKQNTVLPDMDGNSDISLREGLFVIYVDDTYVDV